MTDDEQDTRPEIPSYNWLKASLRGQAMTMGEMLAGDEGRADPDPDGCVINAISDGRTIGDQDPIEHISTLASLGYSIESTADALDMSVEQVEQLTEERVRELMRSQTPDAKIPTDELWRLYHIIVREDYVHFLNVDGVKDVAEQMEWESLVEWIEDEIQGEPEYDYQTWIAAVEEAHRTEGEDESETTP